MNSCLMTNLPDFEKDVFLKGEYIGKIRALTPGDKLFCYKNSIINGKFDSYVVDFYILLCSLGGKHNGQSLKKANEGWVFEDEVTFENLSNMRMDIYNAFQVAVKEINMTEEAKKDIEGNLSTP